MTRKPKIQIILGSTRQNRRGDKVAKAVYETAASRDDLEAELLDLRDWPLPFFDEPDQPSSLQGKYSSPEAQRWVEKIAEADGYLIVTPEYNHGYPAVLKNALDYPYQEWNNKPVSYVSYGGLAGGARSVEQLKQVTADLQLFSLPKTIHIPRIRAQLDENGKLKDESIKDKINAQLDELVEWANFLKGKRQPTA